MRRSRLRAALLIVVAAALGGIGYLVFRNVAARTGSTLRALGTDFLPQVAQRIRDFKRVKMEDGRTVWEITAKEAQYYDESHEVVVREPHMTFHVERDGRECHVSGSEGRLTLDGRDVRSLTLRGGVLIRLDDLELRTEEATYDRARDMITAAGVVVIQGRTLEVRARGMEVAVGPQQVRLLDDVHTRVRTDAAKS